MKINKDKSIKIENCSFEEGETLNLVITGVKGDEEYYFSVNVSKVEEDYTFWAFETPSISNTPDINDKIYFKIPEDYGEGMYLINHVSLINKTRSDSEGLFLQDREILTFHDLKESLFKIVKCHSSKKTCSELADEYNKVLKGRDSDFNRGFGEGTDEYFGLVIVKNCKITTRMRLGQYEIIPYDGISCLDEVTLIKNLLGDINIKSSVNFEKMIEDCKKPSFIIHFPKILADSIKNAAEQIKSESQILCDLLAIQRGANPSILGMTLIDLDSGESLFNVDLMPYTGNLIGGFIAGEDPQFLKNSMIKARSDDKIRQYLSLYNKNAEEFEYFRLWSILESIAKRKNFVNQPLYDWNGNIIKNKKGKDRKIENHKEEIVFELIRQVFTASGMSENSIAPDLNQESIKSLISIWYRHRNCYAHDGGCFPDDASVCLSSEDKFTNCKRAHKEIIDKYGTRNSYNDDYLRTLDTTVKKILDSEIK